MVQNIAEQVKEKGWPQQVVALGRGGFIPGVHLSHLLDVPLVPLMWQTRDGQVNEQWLTTHLKQAHQLKGNQQALDAFQKNQKAK